MVKKVFLRGKDILITPQNSVLSAATVIMFMVVVSQVLGVLRQRILLHFFAPSEYALFLAAFRLPDLVFEVLALGAFSSAFIPVFSKSFKADEKRSWDSAARIVNIGLIIFLIFAIVFSFLAPHFYKFVAKGFSDSETAEIARLARILFAAQGLFVVSYVVTGILESLRRFLIPALAPIFYNLGIILGTLLLVPYFGLYAPAFGVVIGAFFHLFIQLPLVYKLGFRFNTNLRPNKDVRLIGKLAAPRILELSTLQIQKTAELFFASLITVASYTYLSLANSLQLVPIGLFGVSLSKAALPTLTHEEDVNAFRKTFLSTLYQMMFIVLPISTVLIVLRIPIVRLVYGTDIFDWKSTVQTGLVLSAFAIGIPFQAALTLLSRAFYARHDTRTPVIVAIVDVLVTMTIEAALILIWHFPIWSIAFANSIACAIQVILLFSLLSKKLENRGLFNLVPIFKALLASLVSGVVMYTILKFFDRSVWVKRISFLPNLDATKRLDFARFVIDTRYTVNLVALTGVTLIIGGLVYLGVSWVLKSYELKVFIGLIRRRLIPAIPKEGEPITQTPIDSTQT